MIIESEFESQQPIASTYTCEGEDVSLPLRFIDVPTHAKSLVFTGTYQRKKS